MICYIYSNSGSHNSFSPQTSSWECLTWRTELKGIEKMQKEKLDIDLLIAALKAIIIWENYRIIDDFLPSQMEELLINDVYWWKLILNSTSKFKDPYSSVFSYWINFALFFLWNLRSRGTCKSSLHRFMEFGPIRDSLYLHQLFVIRI